MAEYDPDEATVHLRWRGDVVHVESVDGEPTWDPLCWVDEHAVFSIRDVVSSERRRRRWREEPITLRGGFGDIDEWTPADIAAGNLIDQQDGKFPSWVNLAGEFA